MAIRDDQASSDFQEAWTKELDRLMKQHQSPDFGQEADPLASSRGRPDGWPLHRLRVIHSAHHPGEAFSHSMDPSPGHLYTPAQDYAGTSGMTRNR